MHKLVHSSKLNGAMSIICAVQTIVILFLPTENKNWTFSYSVFISIYRFQSTIFLLVQAMSTSKFGYSRS